MRFPWAKKQKKIPKNQLKGTNHFNKLTDELLLSIFQRIPQDDLITSVVRVCKRFAVVILHPTLWRDVTISSFLTLQLSNGPLAHILTRSDRLHSATFSSLRLDAAGVACGLATCPTWAVSLVKIDLRGCQKVDLNFLYFAARCAALRELRMHGFQQPTNEPTTMFNTQCALEQLSNLRLLETLDLSGFPLHVEAVRRLHVPSLKTLMCTWTDVSYTLVQLYDCWSGLPSLEELVMVAPEYFTPKGTVALRQMPRIRKLHLEGLEVTPEFMRDISAGVILNDLQDLALRVDTTAGGRLDFFHLAYPSLQHLTIRQCGMPALVHLDMSRLYSLESIHIVSSAVFTGPLFGSGGLERLRDSIIHGPETVVFPLMQSLWRCAGLVSVDLAACSSPFLRNMALFSRLPSLHRVVVRGYEKGFDFNEDDRNMLTCMFLDKDFKIIPSRVEIMGEHSSGKKASYVVQSSTSLSSLFRAMAENSGKAREDIAIYCKELDAVTMMRDWLYVAAWDPIPATVNITYS
mmetsp:Transcript_19325/g.31649  ORF Transcript_19325/g.31649 Transcript_19325/m.31649 type:complete len:518 (-) Transcript_19325:551-2104(-)